MLTADATREVISRRVADVYANVESLDSATTLAWCEQWLESKKAEMEESTDGAAGGHSQHSDVRIVQSFEYR